GPARLVEPQQEFRVPGDDGNAGFEGRRRQVRAVRRGVAAGGGDLGPAGLHATDARWVAPDRRRLRGRDLPRQLPALKTARTLAGALVAAALLMVAAAAPARAADLEAGRRKSAPRKTCPG